MSSRNGYLTEAQKSQAAGIYQTLQDVTRQIHDGIRNYSLLEDEAQLHLNSLGFETDYIQIRTADLTEPTAQSKHLVILVAANLGTTRLIDNRQIKIE